MLEVWEEEELLRVINDIHKIIGRSRGQRLECERQERNAIIWPPSFNTNIDKPIQEVKQEQTTAFLKFTEQEILKMPKQFRKEFRVDGCTARITKRKSGKNGHCYEVRYRRNGYDIAASSTNLQTAKDKFIEKLQSAVKVADKNTYKAPTIFNDFAMYYFKNYDAKKVAEGTYKKHLGHYRVHIEKFLGKLKVKEITPPHCQEIFDKILNDGKGRTCEEVRSILNQIFDMAIAHELISRNPLAVLLYEKHEREPGAPISKENEKKLLSALGDTNYLLPTAILLYTGVRPNELYTVRHEGDFIIANNSKRKKKKVEFKKIAISPMLRPYLTKPFNSALFPKARILIDKLKEILPNHTLKDCRMTFSTRAQECGVDKVVVKLFMGHSLNDVLGKHYTVFSDEYLIKEAQKIKY